MAMSDKRSPEATDPAALIRKLRTFTAELRTWAAEWPGGANVRTSAEALADEAERLAERADGD